MDRRSFLKTTGAVAGAAALPAAASATETAPVAAPAIRRGYERLTVATRFPLDQPGTSTLLQRMTQTLDAMTEGRLSLAAAVPATAGIEADLMLGFPASEGDLAIAHDIVAGRPGGFDEPSTQGWLTLAGGYRLWSELALEEGRKVFYAGHTGAPLAWAREVSYRDVSGLAIAADGFAGRVVRALGSHTAPAGGDVEIAEGLSPLADTLQPTLTAFAAVAESPFHTAGRMLAVSMPLARFRALASGDQALVETAIAAAAPLAGTELSTHRRMARLTIERRNRPSSILFDRALVRRIEQASADLVSDAAKQHAIIAKLAASIAGFTRLTSPPASLTS